MLGIDISHWNLGVDLSSKDIDFVIAKATEGVTLKDRCFREYMEKSIANDKLIGMYHFMSLKNPIEQAKNFLDTIDKYIGQGILVLDYEWKCGNMLGGSYGALQFLEYVKEQCGVKPLIYINKHYLQTYDWNDVAKGDYGLWLADYTTAYTTLDDRVKKSKNISPWNVQAIRQYTSKGFINGDTTRFIDLNKAFMSEEAWKLYARKSVNEQTK